MIRVLLIDDMRQIHKVHPNTGGGYHARICREFQEGIEALAENVPFDIMYLDHDLGDEAGDGYKVMCWLEEHPEKMPKMVKVVSSNPPGRRNIEMVLAKYYDFDYTTRYWVKDKE